MTVLLDECIPRKLKYSFPEHECQTVPEAGLAGQKIGILVSPAEEAGFDLFLTMDKNLAGRRIAILIIRARSNRLKDLLPHMGACQSAMAPIQPGEVMRIAGGPASEKTPVIVLL